MKVGDWCALEAEGLLRCGRLGAVTEQWEVYAFIELKEAGACSWEYGGHTCWRLGELWRVKGSCFLTGGWDKKGWSCWRVEDKELEVGCWCLLDGNRTVLLGV